MFKELGKVQKEGSVQKEAILCSSPFAQLDLLYFSVHF